MAEPTKRVFPPSTDMVELTTSGEKISLYCLICGAPFGEDVDYLNQAITEWYKHVEEHAAKTAVKGAKSDG